MISFINKNNSEPYAKFFDHYTNAKNANQNEIQALLIASYSHDLEEVDARYVNLKIVDDENFIFFSNYLSPKSKQFESHDQISAVLFWPTINIQIRMKSFIMKNSNNFSDKYFFNRNEEKNALAISSMQSYPINSYSEVKKNYDKSFKNDDLKKRPEYWGGYSFTPYYFEFWEGHKSRINIREVYEKVNHSWKHTFLQP